MTNKYLFIEKFKWAMLEDTVIFEGHPKEGSVYQSKYEESSKTHTLELVPGKRVTIQELNPKNENHSYQGNIQEITRNNLIELNITDEDLDKLIEWMEPKQLPENIQQSFNNVLQRIDFEEKEFMNNAVNRLSQLYAINTIQAEVIVQLIDNLIPYNLSKVEDPAAKLELDKNRGLSINIGSSLRLLDSYASDNRRTGEDQDDLMDAVLPIVREAERRILNNLD